jgi:hypothetical protein
MENKIPETEWTKSAKRYHNETVPWLICSATCEASNEYAKKAIALYSRYFFLPNGLTAGIQAFVPDNPVDSAYEAGMEALARLRLTDATGAKMA